MKNYGNKWPCIFCYLTQSPTHPYEKYASSAKFFTGFGRNMANAIDRQGSLAKRGLVSFRAWTVLLLLTVLTLF